MDFTFFKDVLFDLINKCEQFDIQSIDAFDSDNCFVIHTPDGKAFELRLWEIEAPTGSEP